MNLAKHEEYFHPDDVDGRIHILGCGASGSTIAELLVRLGLTRITLYDFDIVEDKNIPNQMFRAKDIGRPKTEALKEILCEINPDAEKDIRIEGKYIDQPLSGYIFLEIDSIDVRRKIVKDNWYNPMIIAMFDQRLRLTDAQYYAADWKNKKMKEDLLNSMNFTDEEALAETPMSPCNEPLCLVTIVRDVSRVAVQNFVNFIKNKEHFNRTVLVNQAPMEMFAFK